MKKYIITLLILFTGLNLNAFNYYGFIRTGAKIEKKNISNTDITPYFNLYLLNNIREGTATRAQINFNKDVNELNEFDIYSIDDFYFYMDNYNYPQSKKWYLHIGDERRAYTPITLWGSKLRGITGGIILNSNEKSFINAIKINGYWGYSKNKIKGYEALSGEDTSSNKNGQFLQGNYGADVAFNMGKNLNFQGIYSFFQDYKDSLATNEDYLSTPVKNIIIGGKLEYKNKSSRLYFNYAKSTYNSDIRDENSSDLNGNAIYIESDAYITHNLHLIADLSYIDANYMSIAVSSFNNDLFKVHSLIDWRGNKMDLSFDGYFKKNNVAGEAEILTTKEYGISLADSYNFSDSLLFAFKGTFKNADSDKIVNNNYEKWNMYEIGMDITKRFFMGSIFRVFQVTLTSKYNKRNENSIINGENATDREFITGGILSSLDLYLISNRLNILIYRINSNINENIINGIEKFTFNIIKNKWLNHIQYAFLSNNQRSNNIYTRHTIWYGNEYYITFKNVIKFNIGYEKYDTTLSNEESYNEFLSKIEYQYTF